jgi:hypothetical protein
VEQRGATQLSDKQSLEDDFDALIDAVYAVLRKGLPIRPSHAPDELLELAGVIARSVKPEDRLARVDALDRLARQELRRLGLVALRRPAALLFGASGSGNLTERRRAASEAADKNFDHFRKRIEPKIVEQLAWQLHRDSLQYVQRREDGAPFAASGDTPVISETHIESADVAEREALLSDVWSEVYGLRAELIRRESAAADGHQTAYEDAAAGGLWRLARLLTSLDSYLDRYGMEILHGSAAYNAESLIRLAGWTGEITQEQARDLRFHLERAGRWNRDAFRSPLGAGSLTEVRQHR